jgi:CHAT domain-containing protein
MSAEQLLANKLTEYKKAGLKKYLGLIYDQLAQVEIHKGNFDKARQYFLESLKVENEVANYFNCKQELNTLGFEIYLARFKDYDKAISCFNDALAYDKKVKQSSRDSIESLSVLTHMANAYVSKKEFSSAFKYFQLAFDQIKPGMNESGIFNSAIKTINEFKLDYVSTLIIDKGNAFQHQYFVTQNKGVLVQALKTYRAAEQFLDTIKSKLTDLKSKLFWRRSAKRLYENAIEACYLQNNTIDAFYFFEKSRAVLLSDQLNEQRWLNQEEILRQSQLKRNIQQLERRQATVDKSSTGYSELEKQLFESKRELENLLEQIKSSNPLFYQSFVDKNVISIQNVRQKILNDHEGLVQLFAGDSAVYVLAITKQNTFFKKIDKHLYDSLAERFMENLANSNLLNKDYGGFINTSNQLYTLIFQNLNLPPGRLIISPDGKYFPFEALITNPKNHYYFLNDYAVSYTYSARYLLNDFQQKSVSSSHSFFGIAPVEFSQGHATLLGSDESLRKMKHYFSNATMLMHQQASKNNFLNQFTNYGIIQLYAHATDNGENGEPAIYFADSTLSLSDLFYGKKPVTNLIVLSACETALGKVQSGEGVFSFNRGFAALGIPSAISNLWKVDNEATYKLTELFYKYLRKGEPLDVALQQAKKEFMQNSLRDQLPFYWAAPILVGQSEKIPLDDSSWKWLIPVLLLLIFAFWLDRKSFKPVNSR